MDLIQAIKKVEKMDRERSKLVGQQEMLSNDLKELGFTSIKDAEAKAEELKKVSAKMAKHYESGENKFKKEFGHLL